MNKSQTDSQEGHNFTDALRKVVSSTLASSRAAIEAAKSTKPSLHTRFVYSPAKDREPSH
jgi:hypothetical protein